MKRFIFGLFLSLFLAAGVAPVQVHAVPFVNSDIQSPTLIRRVATLAELQALPFNSTVKAVYVEGRTAAGDGYEGTFYQNSSDLSTEVTADTLSGIYVAPNSDATGASGAWVRQFIGAVYVPWFGTNTAPGTTDMATIIQAALDFDADETILPDGTYKTGSGLVVPDDKIFSGTGTILSFATATITTGDNNKITGITLDGTNAGAPYWGIASLNVDNVTIDGVKLVRQRIYTRNNEDADHKDFTVQNCDIDLDLTGTTFAVDQWDAVTWLGIENVKILNNTIRVTNVHRVFKSSDNPGFVSEPDMSDHSTYRVLIDGNTITGSTTSSKQVFDMFIGTGAVEFTNNIIDVTGFSAVVEDKTEYNAPPGGTNPFRSLIVDGNIIRCDAIGVHLQGSYGITEAGFDDDRPSTATISNNDIYSSTTTASIAAIDVRFLHSVNISGNKVERAFVDDAQTIAIRSNKSAEISGNTIKGGAILINKASTNSGGNTFDGDFKEVSIHDNEIVDYDGDAGVYILSLTTLSGNISIKDNDFRVDVSGSSLQRAARFQASVFGYLDFSGNTYYSEVGKSALPIFSTVVISSQNYHSNSWQPLFGYSAAAPTSGVWPDGSHVTNASAATGQPKGWINEVAGGSSEDTRADSTAYTVGQWIAWDSGTTVVAVKTAGTSDSSAPSPATAVGEEVTDGTVVWICMSLTKTTWTSEGNL